MQGYVFSQAKLNLDIYQAHKDSELAIYGNSMYLYESYIWGACLNMPRGNNNQDDRPDVQVPKENRQYVTGNVEREAPIDSSSISVWFTWVYSLWRATAAV